MRYDAIFSIGNITYFRDSTNVHPYELTDFYSYNFIEIDYKFTEKKKFRVGSGVGWIYSSGKENIKFKDEYGYLAACISLKYQVSWMLLELRGDIPLEKVDKVYDQGHLFPISVGFVYKFNPPSDFN